MNVISPLLAIKRISPLGRFSIFSGLTFLCWGNLYRSSIAKHLAIRYLKRNFASTPLSIKSAGISPVNYGATRTWQFRFCAAIRGYRLERRHYQVSRLHLMNDLVIAVDDRCMSALRTFGPPSPDRTLLLSDFLDSSWPRDVPDPSGITISGCNFGMDMIESAVPAIVAYAAEQINSRK